MQWTVVNIAIGEGLTGRGGGRAPLPCLHQIGDTCNPHPARPPASSPAPLGTGAVRGDTPWKAVHEL